MTVRYALLCITKYPDIVILTLSCSESLDILSLHALCVVSATREIKRDTLRFDAPLLEQDAEARVPTLVCDGW